MPDKFKREFKDIQDGISKYEEEIKKKKAGFLISLNLLCENFDSIIVPVKEFYNGKDKGMAGVFEDKEAHNEEGESIDDMKGIDDNGEVTFKYFARFLIKGLYRIT